MLDTRLLEASRKAQTTLLLWQRQRALADATRQFEAIAASIFASQAYDVVLAVYAARAQSSERNVEALLAAVTDALALRVLGDTDRLAKAYDAAILASLYRARMRWGITVDLTDINAAAWKARHGAKTMRGINTTTVDRLRVPLRDAGADAPLDLATTAAVTIAAMSNQRSAAIGGTEALFGWSYGDLATAGVFHRAGVPMLKEWFHTDGCPCPHCTFNDGTVVSVLDPFPEGDMMPPAHTHCACFCDVYPDWGRVVLPVIVLGQPFTDQNQAAA